MVECPTCGDSGFDTSHAMKIHHYKKHGESIAQTNVECRHCGEEFVAKDKRLKEGKRNFCSRDCYMTFRSNELVGEDHPAYKRGVVECAYCGDEISRRPYRIDNVENVFCDNGCQGKWVSENVTGKDHPKWSKVKKSCEICGDTFWAYKSHAERRTCCSNECKNVWQSRNFSRDNHPRWKGGPIKYRGYDFLAIKEKVLKRDQHRCQVCRATVADLGQEPDVHHIKPYREFEDSEKANDMNNLISLCRSCHNKWEGSPVFPTSSKGT